MRNASYIAILCGLLVAVPGCGNKPTVNQPATESANFSDWRYTQSTMGLDPARGFEDFLKSVDPTERIKYINKSVEDGPPTRVYGLKQAYERFVNDPNAEFAAAAKEALTKVPTPEEFDNLRKEEISKMSNP